MHFQVFLPQRRKNGELVVGRLFRGRYRLDGDAKPVEVSLGTDNEKLAHEKLRAIVTTVQMERAGVIAPKIQRQTAMQDIADVIEEFLKSREGLGRDHRYLLGVEQQLERMAREAGWKQVNDISLDSFEKWRSKQSFSPETLNDYLTAANVFLNWMVKTGRIVSNPLKVADKVGMGAMKSAHGGPCPGSS